MPCFIRATRRQALLRLERLCQLPGATVFGDPAGSQGVWPSLLLTLPEQASHDRAVSHLRGPGLGVGRMFVHALPASPYLRERIDDAPLPNARDFAVRSLTIGKSLWLDESSCEHIWRPLQNAVGAWFGQWPNLQCGLARIPVPHPHSHSWRINVRALLS